MAVRLKEWQKPWVAWDGINISDNHVISVLLRAANNLIHVNEDRELYVDLQLDDWIAPDDDFPAWVTVGKILAEDWWQRSGLILNWQTISWDYARLILDTNWTLYIDKGTGIWEEIWWGSGWDSNVKYFNLPNLSNAQVWQAVIDWFLDGNYPIVVYQWETYLVQAQPMANTLRFYDIHPIVTSILNQWFSTVELNTLYLYWDGSHVFDSWSIDRIWISPQVLATNVDYQNPYQPQYPWSPTTKQYVDNRITISATAPDYPIQGTLWYDTTNDELKSYDGTNWNTIGSGGGSTYTAWRWIDITNDVISTTYVAWENVTIEEAIESDMRGPAPSWFHVPLSSEWEAVYDVWTDLWGWSSDWTNLGIALKLPFAGYRVNWSADVYFQGSMGLYWSSSHYSTNNAYDLLFTPNSISINPQSAYYRAGGLSVRCFKNSPVIPTSSWTKLYWTSIESWGIFRSSTDWLISMSSDWQTWITIADKNLWATQVRNSWDTVSAANCWWYFQRWNNYMFPFTWSVTTSSTQVDASNYWPWNYYSSDTFITSNWAWDSTDNANLRWWVSQRTYNLWLEISATDTKYSAWDWILIDSNNDISIDTTWATSWQVLSVDAQWNPVWTTPSGGAQYTAWEWISIDWNNEISIDMTWATNGQVLSTDWNGNIVWTTPSWGSMNLIAGDNIQILDNVTIEDTKGPCPMWFHIPLSTERSALWTEMQALWLDSQWTWYAMENYLYMPAAWYLNDSSNITGWWTYYGVWCADEDAFNFGYTFDTSNRNAAKVYWLNIRPFADSPVVPDSTWSVVYDGSSIATGAWVFWHGIYWVISISSDGVNWITISDKNLWATATYVPWDTITSATRWNYYQWWNCYWFDAAPVTSYDSVDATGYWPGNYYYWDEFVLSTYNRQIWNNSNLWWGVSHQSVTGTMISATDTDTTYSAGDWISIDSNNVISNSMYPSNQGSASAWQVLKIDAYWNTYWDNESWWGTSYIGWQWITINGPYISNDLYPSNTWSEGNALILNSNLEPVWWTVSTFPWMTVLSYGHSTWQNFLDAYNNNAIVYCKASSNTNPWTWVQWRMAFMAFVTLNSWWTPTSVEFQYYRSRSEHNSDANQQDEIYVYKLSNTSWGTWTVDVRNAAAKIAVWTGLSASYSNSGVMTISNTNYANVKAWNIDTYDTGSGTYPRISQSLLEEIVVWLVQTWWTRLESDAILKDSNTWDIFNLVKYVTASWGNPARLEFLGTKRVTYPGTSQWVTGEYTHWYMRLFTIYITNTGWVLSYSCSLDKSTDTETITNYLSVEGSWYTTAFIPTLDHQPTTKKYVDDKFWNTLATDSAYWTVKLWSSTVQTEAMQSVTSIVGRTYWVQVDSNWQMVVNVPWEWQWITKDTTWTTYSMDHVWVGTWVQYGALQTIDANTLYIIL